MELSLLQHAKDKNPARVQLEEESERMHGEGWPENYHPLLVIPSVVDGGRQKKNIRWLTSLAVAHFEHIAPEAMAHSRALVDDDLHTMFCYAQDNSLWIVFPFELFDNYDLEKQIRFYQKARLWGAHYYSHLLGGTEADNTCTSITQTIPLGRDPDAWCNLSAMPFTSDEIHGKPPENEEKTASGKIARPKDIKAFLKKRCQLRYNVVTGRPEILKEGEWQVVNDRILNDLWMEMGDDIAVRPDDINRVIKSSFSVDYHPFLAYLESLPRWDGKIDHIMGLSLSVMVKGSIDMQMLFAQYLKKWLVGMVAGWIDKREVNSAILMLIGPQGKYKTSWFHHLLPPELQSYYCTKIDPSQMLKDDKLKLSQYGLICLEELDTMKDADMNKLKTVMTMEFTNERIPYDRYPEQRKHIASYCATGNNVIFLNDQTGTRRFLPFEIDSIDNPRTYPYNYEGIYAEAYALYKQGFRYYFSEEEEEVLKQHNEKFETPKPEQELIDYFFRLPNDDEVGEFIPTTIAAKLVNSQLSERVSTTQLGRAFSKMGFVHQTIGTSRGFRVVRRKDADREARAVSLAYEARYNIRKQITEEL